MREHALFSHVLNSTPLTLQSLPREQARLCLAQYKIWQTYISPKLNRGKTTKLLLALSGGADSTVMACIMQILSSKLNISLVATSINHGLRDDAKEDINFVLDFCTHIGIVCTSHTIDVKKYASEKHCGVEEAARTLRYQCLEKERKVCGADYIAIAHNADDLNEDVLMRLSRGAGWPALGGMSILDAKRKLVRPLLFLKRSDIEIFLTKLGIQWKHDITNDSMSYTRNRFRKKITPLFKAENPRFARNIQNLWKLSNIDREFWDHYLAESLQKNPWKINDCQESIQLCLPNILLTSIPQAARLRLILSAIKTISPNMGNISADKIFAIEGAWGIGNGGKIFQISEKLHATIQNRNIYLKVKK